MLRPPADPLLAGSAARRRTAIVLACCTIAAVTLGVMFAHQQRTDGFDRVIDSWITGSLGGHPTLLRWLAAPAELVPAGLTSLIMVLACLVTGRLKGAVLAATAVPVSSAVCDALMKPLVHRNDLAYPSGHVTSILALTAMVTVLLVLSPQPLITGPARRLIPLAAGLCACGVVVAVVGLRWHFFTDAIGGAAVGTGSVCALTLALDLPAVSRWLRRGIDCLGARSRLRHLKRRPDPDRPPRRGRLIRFRADLVGAARKQAAQAERGHAGQARQDSRAGEQAGAQAGPKHRPADRRPDQEAGRVGEGAEPVVAAGRAGRRQVAHDRGQRR